MGIKAKVVTGVRWTTISTIVVAISSILKISILTRYLEKGDFGLVAIVSFILAFMELFNDMGISTAILHKQQISLKQYSSLYWVNLIFSVLLYVVVLLLSPILSVFYNQPKLADIAPILGTSLLFAGLGRQFRVVYQKKLNFKTISIVDIIAALMSIIIALTFAVLGYGIYSLVYSTVLQFAIANLSFLLLGYSNHKIYLYCKFQVIEDFLKIGVYQVGGQITNYFNRDLDILIIGKLFTPDVLGGYSLAKQLVFRPFQLINPILSRVASPALARFQKDKHELKQKYLTLLNLVSSVNILVYLVMIIFAPLIIHILYGKDYQNIVGVVRILSIYMIFRAIGNPVGSLVIATGRTDLDFKWNIITLLLVPIAVWAGSLFGVEGVAYALCLSMSLLFYPSWFFLIKPMVNISFREYLSACFRFRFTMDKLR